MLMKMTGTQRYSLVGILLCLVILLPSAVAFADENTSLSLFSDYDDPAAEFLNSAELWDKLDDTTRPLDEILDEVYTFEHDLPIGEGRTLFVTEFFSLRALLRQPARAAFFLTGPGFRGNFWSIPVEGYNGPEMAVRRGFFAYTVDYIGVGRSYLPEDGSQVNYRTNAEPVRIAIDFVRFFRKAHRVDLIGEGYGAEIASLLADEPQRVRSVVMSTLWYEELSPFGEMAFSAGFEGFLRSQPNGYWQPSVDFTLAHSPNQGLRDYVFTTQPGAYPTGAFLQVWDFGLPIIEASAAKAPALIILGDLDPLPAPGDLANLAADWKRGASLTIIPGGDHVPRIEAREVADQYFAALFDFIDP